MKRYRKNHQLNSYSALLGGLNLKKILAFSVVFLLLLLGSGYVFFFYFMPNNQVVPAFEEDKLHLVVEGEVDAAAPGPMVRDQEILLPMETVKKFFDPNIYWDNALKKVTVTTRDKVIRMKTDSLNAIINNKPVTLKIPVVEEKGIVFVPIEFLADFYSIEIQYLKDANVVVIDRKNSVRQIAEPIGPAEKGVFVRKGRSIRYPVLKKLDIKSGKPEDNILRIFEEYEKWYKVRTSEGMIGYVEKKHVVVRRMLVKEVPVEQGDKKAWKPEKGRINLTWEMMYSKGPDTAKLDKMNGVDVLSPTWFQVADEKGTLINRASSAYTEWAHNNGYKVWALVANGFDDAGATKRLLNNTDARDNIIRQLLVFAALYKLDGINIDFENIDVEDRDALTQFVREAAPLLREQGMVVSIDVTIPDGSDNWSRCYDRKALAEAVDYVMLMAYDQHWASSPQAGSVAQLSWVERNVQKTLTMVPREKLLLGLPFYTRLWKEEAQPDGRIKVSNPKALSMESAKKLILENDAKVAWDAESGQYYAEYTAEGATFKLWLEDGNSINLKSGLVQKYRLAGAAAWKRSDAIPEVWSILDRNLKGMDTYQDWQALNKDIKYVFN
jgi:spore germination protein YaaH